MAKNNKSKTSLPSSDQTSAAFLSPESEVSGEHPPEASNEYPPGTLVAAAWSGPIPPPSILADYDAIVSGAADRILAMAERQSAHRQSMEVRDQALRETQARQDFELNRDAQAKTYYTHLLGNISAALVALTFIVGSFWLISMGYSTPGTILGGVSLVSLVAVFIYGSRLRKNDSLKAD